MELAVAVLGSGVLSTIISCLFQMRSDKKKKLDKFETGMCLLLLSSLKRDGNDLIAKGKVSKNEYDSFEATYNAYKALGGDGWADSVKAQIDALEKNLEV